MQQHHSSLHPPQPVPIAGWRQWLFILLLFLGGIASPLALLLSLPLWFWCAKSWDHKERWRGTWAFAICFVAGYVALAWFAHTYAIFWQSFSYDIQHGLFHDSFMVVLKWWGYHTLLAPVFALALEMAYPQTNKSDKHPHRPQIALHVAPLVEQPPAASLSAAPHIMIPAPFTANGSAIIGAPLEGDLYEWIEDGLFTWPERRLGYLCRVRPDHEIRWL
jgi:hypothetical protein